MPREFYRGQRIVALTTCVLDGRPIFAAERPTMRFGEILVEEAGRQGCDLILACFMPEHLHVLMRGRTEESDSLAAFERFKLRTAVIFDRFHSPTKWQKNYYDHVIRCGHDWRGQARYNALNPVRRDLVEDAYDYPYYFSSLDTKEEVLAQIFWEERPVGVGCPRADARRCGEGESDVSVEGLSRRHEGIRRLQQPSGK